MEKRALIAVGLSIIVLVLFSYFMPSPAPVRPPVAPVTTNQAQPTKKEAEASPQTPERPRQTPTVSILDKDIIVDTDLYTALISTKGGTVKSWKLKKYTDAAGAPLDMVVYKESMRPFTVAPDNIPWAEAAGYGYSADASGITLTGKDESKTLTLTYTALDGKKIIKAIKFTNGKYELGSEISVEGYKGYTLYMGESFGSLTEKAKKGYGFTGPITLVDGEKQKDNPEKIAAQKEYKGKQGWTGITDKYFMAIIAPDAGIDAVVGKGTTDWGYTGVKVGSPKESFLIFIGPKEYDILKTLDRGLEKAVDFGWFTFIAKPVFIALKFFFGLVHNYGWAIIIITVIIKLIFAPLTHKSQKSMKRLQKLQPHMAELKEKYKGDPQKMNMEMMDLYKKHKVNPMGGCLPMVIQIPVFVALYNVLNNSIELRHAPFMWWLTDLSAKDPYYILPILMGVSMLVMQKMTPTSLDSTQNRIMMVMPVVMTFMFINLPCGLVLYFTISNLLSMAQQVYINKYSKE